MTESICDKTDFITLRLTGPQTIAQAEDLRIALLDGLQRSERVVLDCSLVSDVDVTFLQLVYAARRDAGSSGRRVTLAQPAQGGLAHALIRAGLNKPDGEGWADPFWAGEEIRDE